MAGEEPIIENSPAPAPVDAPAPAPVAAEAPKSPHEIPTLLETIKAPAAEAPKVDAAPAPEKPAEPKAEDKPAAPAEKPVEAKPEEKPAEVPAVVEDAPLEGEILPADYKFEFNENVKPQDEKVAAFTEFAREHKMTPEAAQKAVNYFNEAASAFVAEQEARQNSVWNETRAEWRKEVLGSPIIGGAGHLAAMGIVAEARDLATEVLSNAQPGTPKYQQVADRIENFVRVTGAGDHPVFLEMLHALGSLVREPRAPKAIPSPTKNNGVKPSNSLYAPKRQ